MTTPYSVYSIAPKTAPRGDIGQEISSQESLLFSGFNIGDYNPDGLVAKKGLDIYKKMREDEQVKACLTLKKYARLSTGWEIKPGDEDDKLSVELADFVRLNTKRIKGTFYDTLLGILTALDYGFSISEKVMEYIETGDFKGKIGIKAIKSREPFGYGFKTDPHGNLEGITFSSAGLGLGAANDPYPPEKFVVFSYNKEFSNWFGKSDLREAYRSWFSKNIIIKFYNIFLERFGSPTVYATYPSSPGKAVLDAVDDVLKNLQAKSSFRIPENIKVDLLEATRKGNAGYESAIELHNTMISRAILVPELLGFSGRKSGSQSLGQTQFDIFVWILEKLGKDIEETIVEEQIVRPLIDLNYSDVHEEQYPIFKLNSLSEENIEARAKIVEAMVKAGVVDPNEEWVREYMLFPKKTEEDKLLVPKPEEPKPKEPAKEEPEVKKEQAFLLIEKYQLNRPPTKFEEKVNFVSFANEWKSTDDLLRDALIDIFTVQRDDLLKSVERYKVIENEDYRFIAKLQLTQVGKVKSTLQNHMVKAHLDSKLEDLEELKRGGVPVTIVNKFQDVPFQPWDPVPPTEAIEQFNNKVLASIAENGEKVLIVMGKTRELKYYDSRAFAIAGVERDYILKEAKLALQTGIKQGLSGKQVQDNLRIIFDKYIPTGEIKDGKLVSPARLETIVRTNISDAVNLGRRAMVEDPLISKFVPYLLVSAIIDSRTTEFCEWLDGKSFRRTDPLLTDPPYHFNCRTVLVPITQIEVDKEVEAGGGIEVSDPADNPIERAKGFAGSGEFNIIRA